MDKLIREMPSEEVLEAFVQGLVGGRRTVIFDMDQGKFVDRNSDAVSSDTE